MESIKELYRLGIWELNPYSKEGQTRFKNAIDAFGRLLSHVWIKKLLERDAISILEVCAGTGIGGVALAKVFMERNIDVELLLVDIREDDLKLGSQWGSKVLGKSVDYVAIDAKEVHKIGRKFDVALMYGFSSPHFDPWEMLKLQASISECLNNEGIFLMEEGG